VIFFPLAPLLGSLLPYWSTGLITQFLDHSQAVGLLGRVISSSQVLYLNTGQHKHRKTLTHIKHPCSRRDSIPQSRPPSDRRLFMLQTAHLPRPANYWILNWKEYRRSRPWPNLRYKTDICIKGLRNLTEYRLFGPRIKPRTSRILSMFLNTATATSIWIWFSITVLFTLLSFYQLQRKHHNVVSLI
jgi:hypothetical protein